MKILIRKSKENAFQEFVVTLKRHSQIKTTRLEFLEISEGLMSDATSLVGTKKENYSASQKKTRNRIKVFFNKVWEEKAVEIERTLSLLKKSRGQIEWLVEHIPEYTGNNIWPFDQIYIFPAITSWASCLGNYISIGITPQFFLEKDLLSVLAHEIVHLNTGNLKIPGLNFPKDAGEITTNLITNRIVRDLNLKLGLSIRNLKLSVPFREYSNKLDNLNNLVTEHKRFISIIKKVDDFLVSQNHIGKYK